MTSYDFPRLPPQTDIPRLKQGMVGAQVTDFICKKRRSKATCGKWRKRKNS